MPQRIAFSVAACLLALTVALAWHYRAIHAEHTSVVGKAVSVEVRSTRVNSNSTRRLYHLIVSIPVSDDKANTVILQDGANKKLFGRGDDVPLLYPHNRPQEARLLNSADQLWPILLAGAMALIAAMAGVMFRREAQADCAGKIIKSEE